MCFILFQILLLVVYT